MPSSFFVGFVPIFTGSTSGCFIEREISFLNYPYPYVVSAEMWTETESLSHRVIECWAMKRISFQSSDKRWYPSAESVLCRSCRQLVEKMKLYSLSTHNQSLRLLLLVFILMTSILEHAVPRHSSESISTEAS